MSLCPFISPHCQTHLGHGYRFCVALEKMAKAHVASHGFGLTPEICIALATKGGSCYFSAFEAFLAMPTPVFHALRTVCRRFGFRALHQCQTTALLQPDTRFSFGRCAVCSRSLGLHVRRWPPHEPSFFSPCQASCSRQFFSLFRTANRNSLHRRRLMWLRATRHFPRARHVSLQLRVHSF